MPGDFLKIDFEQSILSKNGVWYRNLQPLGTGGNATTLLVLATSGPSKGTLFALKLFRKVSKPERRENFLAERAFLHTCDHPAIMRVYDEGVYRGEHPFVVAEYLPRTLLDVMRAGASTVEKLNYAMQLLSALEYLDNLKPPVIHRDVKPRNIFVKGTSCVLGDFGLMKHLPVDESVDRASLKESLGPGMPFFYRTPDLVAYAKGESGIGTKSDVYQLGLVLAQLFSGRNPQKAANDILDPIETDRISFIPGALSPGITSLIARMLAEDPANRESASRLLDPWKGLFLDAARRAWALEGRVF